MAKHTKTTWQDRNVQFPNRFTKSSETSTEVTLTASPGTVTQAGTAISAQKMNALETAAENANNELPPVAVTLKHGLQVVTTEQKGPFNVKVKGNTLVNLFGNDGNFSKLPSPVGGQTLTQVTDALFGTTAAKATRTNAADARLIIFNIPVKANTTYVVIAHCKAVVGTLRAVYMQRDSGGVTIGATNTFGTFTSTTSFVRAYAKFTTASNCVDVRIQMEANAANDEGIFDGFALYEVDTATYNALTDANNAEYFPYVDGIQHVQNPAITVMSDNLIKPFTSGDWTIHANAEIVGPYELTLRASASFQESQSEVTVIPGQAYTLKGVIPADGYVAIKEYNSSGAQVANNNITVSNTTRTITINSATVVAKMYIGSFSAGTFIFKQLHLVLGSTAPTQFLPYNESYAYGVTDSAGKPLKLAGDAKTGVYDLLFQQGAEWRKLKRWEHVTLDGSLPWQFNYDMAGFKSVKITISGNFNGMILSTVSDKSVVKYDGKIIERWTGVDRTDTFNVGSVDFVIQISDAEIGFPETGTITVNDIKSVMNGWKLVVGTGNWVSILDGSAAPSNQTATLATVKAPGWTGWGTLTYQLADEKTEIVNVEGALMLGNGGNHVTVGEAVIVREKAKPVLRTDSLKNYYINVRDGSIAAIPNGSQLSKRADRIARVYKNGVPDNKWFMSSYGNSFAYGNMFAEIKPEDYDPTAEYTVTYIALDEYAMSANVVDVSGEYWNNVGSVAAKNAEYIAELATDVSGRLPRAERLLYLNNTVFTTTGTANVYTASIPGLVNNTEIRNVPIKVKINVNSTAASTLNLGFGAIGIKKANGNDMINLKANGIYTLVYDGTNFILQGEGGSGNAQPSEVLSGKTFSNDTGDQVGTLALTGNAGDANVLAGQTYYNTDAQTKRTGTMPYKSSSANYPADDLYSGGAGTVYVKPQLGYYAPVGSSASPGGIGGWLSISDPDFIAANIPADKNIFGLQGSMPVRAGENDAIANYLSGTTVKLLPPNGYYDGVDDLVRVSDPDLIANNIVDGVNILGVTGTRRPWNGEKKWVRGSIYTNATQGAFTVGSLGFTPKYVLISGNPFDNVNAQPLHVSLKDFDGVTFPGGNQNPGGNMNTNWPNFVVTYGSDYINALPAYWSNLTFYYIIIGD